uniref:Uncharacterized protein n=1 Tax=Panagrolaimus sp. PS1159 TaxID=55785 RepID=A0AC35GLE9_9BILA
MKRLFLLFLFLSLFSINAAQFGEIASIVGSVLGGGAGLGSAASGAAAAGSGAAGALGNIGQLYQLAQTALSLTGTGVGILNQASESSWFPAAVEHAVKNNRDFQEKLLAGGAGTPGAAGATSTKIGKEYGKNFEIEEGSEETETKSPSLEKELKELENEENLTKIGKPSIEEVDDFGRPINKAEGGLTGPIPTPAPLLSKPKITVEIPQKVKKLDVKDYEELLGKMWPGEQEKESQFSTDEEENQSSEMVPELQKLIHDLKKSNLSKTEFQEIVKQLESNHEDNIGQPRENTTPITPLKSSELGSEEQEQVPEPPPIKKYGKNIPAFRRILGTRDDTSTVVTSAPSIDRTTKSAKNRSGYIPAFSTTKQPQSVAVKNGFTHRVDSEATTKILIAPRAVPTVVAPRPVAKGVIQQRFYPNQQKPNPYHTAQTHAAVPQPQINVPQPQQQTYMSQPQQTYADYQQQYQEYLRKYYPAYVPFYQNPQQQYQNFYQNPAQAHGQRIYPLQHPYGQGTLITNQQPFQQNVFGKK